MPKNGRISSVAVPKGKGFGKGPKFFLCNSEKDFQRIDIVGGYAFKRIVYSFLVKVLTGGYKLGQPSRHEPPVDKGERPRGNERKPETYRKTSHRRVM